MKSNFLRNLSFGLLGLLILVLMAATCVEKVWGTSFVVRHVYGSVWFAACWAVVAVAGVSWLLRCRVQHRWRVFLLHAALVIILLGALVTHVWGVQGSVHLRQGEAAEAFTTTDGRTVSLPFSLMLEEFRVEYYAGTSAPSDFVSRIVLDGEHRAEVSMNHIASYGSYRFYQSRYDADGQGSTLSVACDPWGIGITYTGYGLLLVSCLLFVADRRGTFRRLLNHPSLRAAGVAALLLSASSVQAEEGLPRTLPRGTADAFGRLYVYYNDRVCPLQTLAKDFTVKLCGKPTYRGLTAEQVLTGWFFYYDDWKTVPCIRVKGDGVQRLSAVATGALWRIFPCPLADDSLRLSWYSLADRLPKGLPREQEALMRSGMNYVAEQVARKDYARVEELVEKIRRYQRREGGALLPTDLRLGAERWYNRLNDSLPLAVASIVLGLLSFVYCVRCLLLRRRIAEWVERVLSILMGAGLLWVLGLMVLRGVVSGHLPMSNGHETMQLLALCAAVLTLVFRRRLPLALPFGFLVCGLALMVSMLGERNPQVGPLMPVLASPLLSVHVAVIMLAYSLLAFLMLNGVAALVLQASRRDCTAQVERLHTVGRLLLYPAVFLLAVGIFVGAVWANVSWGRYWGWDPKEVWALVTLLVYALALHPASLPCFRRPLFFHAYVVGAFCCVLITYFGVNFLLGGMHSYA